MLIACGSGGSSDTNDTSPSTDNTSTINNDIPVGISSFALGVPSFPRDEFLSVIKSIQNNATNQLWFFPETPDNSLVLSALENLINDGHKVRHQIYIFNGPAVRRKRDVFWNKVLNKSASESDVRSALKNNQQAISEVKLVYGEVISFATTLKNIGVDVVICPELEDNQTDETYKILHDLLIESGWNNSKIVRSGVENGRYQGVAKEVHPRDMRALKNSNLAAGDVINQDGTSFVVTKGDARSFDYAETLDSILYAKAIGVIFYIWPAGLQGFKNFDPDVNPSEYNGSYSKRSYLLQNKTELIKLLQSSK